jgi:hypothetical protein
MAKTRKYNQRKSTRGKTPKKKNKMRQKGSGRSSRTYHNLNACELLEQEYKVTGCNGRRCSIITRKYGTKLADCQATCENGTCVGWRPSTSIVPSPDSNTQSLQLSDAHHQKNLSKIYKDNRKSVKYNVHPRSTQSRSRTMKN